MDSRNVRQICARVVSAAFLFAALSGAKCWGGDCNCLEKGGIASEITGNHGHSLDVPAADFVSHSEPTYTYSIRGTATHDHQVTFTGSQLEVVSRYNSATVTSTVADGHTHDVTLDCNCL